jgi:fumarylacetoacetate (FAA) hydrolase
VKLASLRTATPDGRLIVVSTRLERAVSAAAIAPTLQIAIETWQSSGPRLEQLYRDLNAGAAADSFALDCASLAAPLPRAPQWLDGSAFLSHAELMEKVFNVPPIEGKTELPLMYQGGSDDLLGATQDMPLPSEADGIDFEGEVAVMLDRVPMGTSVAQAGAHIKLLMLANDWSLRALAQREFKIGFGWVQSKPATSFSPVAVTPDELGDAWRAARVHLPLLLEWNGGHFGRPHAGAMHFGFDELVAHAARTRNLAAGTIIGSGTVSNPEFREVGSACIAERRGIEVVDTGKPTTSYMRFGDRVRIDMRDHQGRSIFGAIDQRVTKASPP